MDSPFFRRLLARINNLVSRGSVTRVDDSAATKLLQVTLLEGELRDAVPHLEPYGITARAPDGAEVLVTCAGGRRDAPVAVVVASPAHRVTGLDAGEVVLYTSGGTQVRVKSGRVVIVAPSVRLGSDSAADPVALSSKVAAELGALKTAFSSWVPVPGDGGAALKAILTALFVTWPGSVAAGKVTAE